jgi:hypothetical protein
MRAPARLAAFAAVLAAVFGGAALAGGAIDPDGAEAGRAPHAGQSQAEAGHGAGDRAEAGHAEGDRAELGHAGGAEADAGHADTGHAAGAAASPAAATLPGLAAAQDGHRLELADATLGGGATERLRFRILDAKGRPVRSFDEAHEKRMHLIVVRRDLEHFQHLHPEMAADGTWTADVDVRDGGTYRVFADFTRDGRQRTLGADVHVPGRFTPRPVPAVAATAQDDRGLEVRLRRDGDRVAFDVLRDGRTVNAELEPYLGAKGHLVTLRAGDLAYLHTHPDGDRLAFETELPTAGRYRMWVQFQLDGQVHTAAFTQEEAA